MEEADKPKQAENSRLADVERRKAIRKPLRGNAQLIMAGRPPIAVRMANLGLGGMSILSLESLPLKVPCTLRFSIQLKGGGEAPVEVEAVVLHSVFSGTEGGFIKVGLQFRNLGANAASVIANFLMG